MTRSVPFVLRLGPLHIARCTACSSTTPAAPYRERRVQGRLKRGDTSAPGKAHRGQHRCQSAPRGRRLQKDLVVGGFLVHGHIPEPFRLGLDRVTTKIRTIRGPESTSSPSTIAFTLVRAIRVVYHQQTKNLLATLRRSTFRIGRKRRYRKTAVVSESYGISTRQQCEQRRPSATPDSTASQVSIGPDTTEPANAYASAGPWKRPPSPEPDEASAKSALGQQESCHSRPQTATPWNRQPHRPEPAGCLDAFRQAGGRQ